MYRYFVIGKHVCLLVLYFLVVRKLIWGGSSNRIHHASNLVSFGTGSSASTSLLELAHVFQNDRRHARRKPASVMTRGYCPDVGKEPPSLSRVRREQSPNSMLYTRVLRSLEIGQSY